MSVKKCPIENENVLFSYISSYVMIGNFVLPIKVVVSKIYIFRGGQKSQ